MSKINLTTDQIHKAIEDLIRQGSSPTVAKVRAALGDRGNANTILAGIQAWFAERGSYLIALLDHPDAVADINLKTAMRDATNKSVAAINKINADFEQKVAEDTRRLEAFQAELNQRETALQEAAVAKDAHIADLQTRLTQLDEDLHVARAELKLERDMVADLETKLTQHTHEAELSAASHQDYKAQAEQQIQALTTKITQSEADSKQLLAINKDLEIALATLKADLRASQALQAQSADATARQIEHLSADARSLRQQLTDSAKNHELLIRTHAEVKSALESQLATLQNSLFNAAKHQQADLTHVIGMLSDTIRANHQSMTISADRIFKHLADKKAAKPKAGKQSP